MRDELMTQAIAWELDARISANFAHVLASSNRALNCFCPHEICLVPVSPARKKNSYFIAPGRHKPGCPNESNISGAAAGGNKQSYCSPPIINSVPSVLGRISLIPKKSKMPTRDELIQLSQSAAISPMVNPGTLEEVVVARRNMDYKQRALSPLCINGVWNDYNCGFVHVSSVEGNMNHPYFLSKIVFGMAQVQKWDHYVAVIFLGSFMFEGRCLPLRVLFPVKSCPEHLIEWVGCKIQFFISGVMPVLAKSKKALELDVGSFDECAGCYFSIA